MKKWISVFLIFLFMYTPLAMADKVVRGDYTFTGDVTGKAFYSKKHVVDVRAFGATGNGTTNDNTSVNIAAATLSYGGVLYFPSGTYLITGLDLSSYDGITIRGDGMESSIIKRGTWATGVGLITTGTNTVVEGLQFDGDQDSGPGDVTCNGDYGLVIDDNCVVRECKSVENYDHGFRANGQHGLFFKCIGDDNGMNPGSLGTGDGFYTGDGTADNVFLECSADGNARGGITTTANLSTSVRHKVLYCEIGSGNGYFGISGENTTDVLVQGCTVNHSIIGKDSTRMRIFDNYCPIGLIYCDGADYCRIERNTVSTTTVNERIYVNGDSYFVVDNVVLYTGSPSSGYAINLTNTNAANTGVVTGNRLEGAYRGIIASGVMNAYGNTFIGLLNAARQLCIAQVDGTDVEFTDDCTSFEVRQGRIVAYSTAIPTTGTWPAGSVVWNGAPSAGERVGWVCFSTGTSGIWGAIDTRKTFDGRQFGADPTGTADSATAIQAAIDAAESTGGSVFLEEGVYSIGSGLTITEAIEFFGTSPGHYQDTTLGSFIEVDVDATAITLSAGAYLHDFAIEDTDDTMGADKDGIYINTSNSGERVHMQNVRVRGMGRHGLHIYQSNSGYFVGCEFRDNDGDGLHLEGNSGTPNANNNAFYSCIFNGNGDDGIDSPQYAHQNGFFFGQASYNTDDGWFFDTYGNCVFMVYGESNTGEDALLGTNAKAGYYSVTHPSSITVTSPAYTYNVVMDRQGSDGLGFNALNVRDRILLGGTTDNPGELYIYEDGDHAGGDYVRISIPTSDISTYTIRVPIIQTYSLTNVSADRAYDADATTTEELADALGTLIADLQACGLIQ